MLTDILSVVWPLKIVAKDKRSSLSCWTGKEEEEKLQNVGNSSHSTGSHFWSALNFLFGRGLYDKIFTAVIYGFSLQARVFFSGKPSQPSLMFVDEARSLP